MLSPKTSQVPSCSVFHDNLGKALRTIVQNSPIWAGKGCVGMRTQEGIASCTFSNTLVLAVDDPGSLSI